jgi:hypothetical protein
MKKYYIRCINHKPIEMKHIYLCMLLLFTFTFGVNAQEQVVLKQTFIKVEEGNNYAEDLKEKFSKFAQARIDAGYQSGWHLWEVVGNPQAAFSHIIVEPMTLSQMEKERNWDDWRKMRSETLPSMTDNDWRAFMEDVREKRNIVAEAMFVGVKDIGKTSDVSLPDDVGVINFMKVAQGKNKTYETMELGLYREGLGKNDPRSGWSLGRRIDKVGTDIYWNYFTVDWFSNYTDFVKTAASVQAWDADKNYEKMLNIRDLRESVVIRKVMMLD